LPTVVRSIVAALELNEFDFNSSQNGFFFADDDILPATATLQEMAAAVGALRDKLLAATELGFEADGNISSDGDGGCYIDLYSETCNKKVEFWAHVERDSSNNVEAVILQTSISDYTPPAFALKDAFVARTGLSLKWQNSSGYFFYGDSVELGEGETMQDRVESLVDELYECEDENDPFSELEAGGTEGSFYKATYFCNAGYFTIICGLTSGGNTVVNIQAAPFNPEVPGRVSVIALQLGAGTVEIVNEQYVCLAKSDGRYGTAGYTRRQIVDNKWGEEFLADIITNKGMTSYVLQGEITYDENGVVRATYFNESNGFTLVMSMPYDEDGETIGIQIIIIPPAPQPDPGE